MYSEKTLLERLSNPKQLANRTLSENRNELIRSILRHLQRLLNSRQGHAAAQMDYGVPESSSVVHNVPDSISGVQRAIRATIEKFEPRLCSVNVTNVVSEDDPFTLRFQITAQLATPRDRPYVCFDTFVDSAGRIQVRT